MSDFAKKKRGWSKCRFQIAELLKTRVPNYYFLEAFSWRWPDPLSSAPNERTGDT